MRDAAGHKFPQLSKLAVARSAPRIAPQKRVSHRLTVRITFLTCVELWGFEPQTSCMPSSGNPSTEVHQRRSPSLQPPSSPPESRHVAVLPCCTTRCPPHSGAAAPSRAPGQRREIPCCHAPILPICRIADVWGGAPELRSHSAGRVRRVRLCQSVEHLAEVFKNPEMALAVTQNKPRPGQIF